LAYYRALEREQNARIITDRAGLNSHVDEWTKWESESDADPEKSHPLGLVITMESADPVLSPDQLEDWFRADLRLIGPAHSGSGRYAGSTGSDLGLTDMGPALLAEMECLGILLDLTHLSDRAFWESLEHYHGRMLASHNNCRALVPHQREFDDAQLSAIIERDGVIGATLGNWQLQFGWIVGAPNDHLHVTLDRAVDHIDHICQLVGDTHYVAIGSDLDGDVGSDEFPSDLDTISDLANFPEVLSNRGYSDDAVASILHRNWLDFLRRAWPIHSSGSVK